MSAEAAVGPLRRVGFCYHPDVPGAGDLAEQLASLDVEVAPDRWLQALERDGHDEAVADRLPGTDLLVCVGGDGTVLQASGLAIHTGAPVFGVRMGRLGFLAESTGEEAAAALGLVLGGAGRIEERSLIQATNGGADTAPVHALNDVVIGRGSIGRTVSVGVRVDGVLLAEYRTDAVIVATATGSTGYALAVNGPILFPTSDDMLVVPVAPHLSYNNALVLPATARIELEVERGFDAMMIVDGRGERPLGSGAVVSVTRSPLVARFVRLGGEEQFYANLARRLGWLRLDHVLDAGDPPKS